MADSRVFWERSAPHTRLPQRPVCPPDSRSFHPYIQRPASWRRGCRVESPNHSSCTTQRDETAVQHSQSAEPTTGGSACAAVCLVTDYHHTRLLQNQHRPMVLP